VTKPAIDETQRDGELPESYVQRLSVEKAAAVAGQIQTPALILAADTIVIDGDVILGKPADAEEARLALRHLRGRFHRVCTAISLQCIDGDSQRLTRLDCTEVHMRDFSDDEIEAYIASGDPFDKAGSYAIQHPEFAPVDHIHGSYTNVMGLPLEMLRETLAEIGWVLETES
jgi:MAF protein